MSCNGPYYLPQPPRAWSRVQNRCSLEIAYSNNSTVKVPYSNLEVPGSTIGYYLDMLNKGNVLQYKANSSNLTKAQRYAKIARGQWVNRNTTWASQSDRGYTNPNTTSLQRNGNVFNIAIDPNTGLVLGPTNLPVTCPRFVQPMNEDIPINGGGGGTDIPVVPPPIITQNNDNVIPVVPPLPPLVPIVIQDGGTMNCSVQENICTGAIKRHLAQQLCNPTSDSDVPGPIEQLCWNDGNPTWYPRQRYIMTNSDNKWPTNYKLLVAANTTKPIQNTISIIPPILVSVNINNNELYIEWHTNDKLVEYISGYVINIVEYEPTLEGNIVNTGNFLHISKTEYYISGQQNLIVESESVIYLPLSLAEGESISILNKYSNYISVNTQNGELLFNSLYLPSEGGTTISISPNSTGVFMYVKNVTTNIYSWTVNMY